jgi:hypothetical protein
MLLRLPADLHYEPGIRAEAGGESVNSLVVEAVENPRKNKKRAAARLDAAKGLAGRGKIKAPAAARKTGERRKTALWKREKK